MSKGEKGGTGRAYKGVGVMRQRMVALVVESTRSVPADWGEDNASSWRNGACEGIGGTQLTGGKAQYLNADQGGF